MAITRKTVIDRIELNRDGSTGIRIALLVLDGQNEIGTAWHRTVVPDGGDLNARIAAVEAQLQARGAPALDADDKQRLGRARAAAERGAPIR